MKNNNIQTLCTLILQTITELDSQVLTNLDFGDQKLVESKLRDVLDSLDYLKALGEAKCSVVLEALQRLGGSYARSIKAFDSTGS